MTNDARHTQVRIWPESGTASPIPEKLYFKISEVCEITGLKQHAIRYWESEFNFIKPQRSAAKQRLYRRVDVETILKLKKLLHEEGFTIAGAKRYLTKQREQVQKVDPKPGKEKVPVTAKEFIHQIKNELVAIKTMLQKE